MRNSAFIGNSATNGGADRRGSRAARRYTRPDRASAPEDRKVVLTINGEAIETTLHGVKFRLRNLDIPIPDGTTAVTVNTTSPASPCWLESQIRLIRVRCGDRVTTYAPTTEGDRG